MRWSFARLDAEVSRLAELLVKQGIKKGDVVGLYLPMVPEAAAAFLAVVEIGAIIMPLFSGFGPRPLIDRFTEAGASAVITCPSFQRRGKIVPMHQTVLDAVSEAPTVRHVILLDRIGDAVAKGPLDVVWSTVDVPGERQRHPEMLDAETPAMLMFTSGTTGKPKGTVTSPALVIPPETSRSPDWFREGVRPTHGPTFFEDVKRLGSSTADR